MPAITQCEYTDDGCTVYRCSACWATVESRTDCKRFLVCPFCETVFTHTEEANREKADNIRDERLERRYKHGAFDQATKVGFRYHLRIMVPNTRDNKLRVAPPDRECPDIETWYGDRSGIPELAQLDFPHQKHPLPFIQIEQKFGRHNRAYVIKVMKEHRGCPMWLTVELVK